MQNIKTWHACAFVLGAALLASSIVHACGGNQVRQHAAAVVVEHHTLESAGDAIVVATERALAECPAVDGPERTACIDEVAERMLYAADARDALIPLVEAHRAAVLGMPPSEGDGVGAQSAVDGGAP